ncbi:hypothetical protein [Methylobacterium sp. WL120]|uniref:hypothetical protein n=1 Tax=Methylobacterium sp. WL120 TaxID=2603887 RepID=UPI0011C81A81|nr:hypothetical protein [Methylobacterium sp. WL120]TXM68176.1 hypothetical protein FV229_08350 [Methylobacterium sp. WL120]
MTSLNNVNVSMGDKPADGRFEASVALANALVEQAKASRAQAEAVSNIAEALRNMAPVHNTGIVVYSDKSTP